MNYKFAINVKKRFIDLLRVLDISGEIKKKNKKKKEKDFEMQLSEL